MQTWHLQSVHVHNNVQSNPPNYHGHIFCTLTDGNYTDRSTLVFVNLIFKCIPAAKITSPHYGHKAVCNIQSDIPINSHHNLPTRSFFGVYFPWAEQGEARKWEGRGRRTNAHVRVFFVVVVLFLLPLTLYFSCLASVQLLHGLISYFMNHKRKTHQNTA